MTGVNTELNVTKTANDFSVKIYDGTMEYSTISTYVTYVSKAIAKSICRHFNRELLKRMKECGCGIDIYYFTECQDSEQEPQLDYWR